MNMKDQLTTPPIKEGIDIPSYEAVDVWEFLLVKGHTFLDETAFVKGGPFKESDIQALKEYYQAVLDYEEQKFGEKGAVFNRSLREHLGLAERLGKVAAPLLGIDTYQLQAIMLTHDLGRLFSHRRGRNNAVEALLTRKLGFSEECTKLLPPDSLWTDISQASLMRRLEEITTENNGIVGVVELLDVLAKWKDKKSGELRKIEDIIPKTIERQNSPDPSNMWPSELKRQRKITSADGMEAVSTKYTYLGKWFAEKTGSSVNEFVVKVEQSLRENPIQENWF